MIFFSISFLLLLSAARHCKSSNGIVEQYVIHWMPVQILHSVGYVTLPLGPGLPSHQELGRPTPKHEQTQWREEVLIGTQPVSLLSFPLV